MSNYLLFAVLLGLLFVRCGVKSPNVMLLIAALFFVVATVSSVVVGVN